MVSIKRGDKTLLIPYQSYIADYKPYGWTIVFQEDIVEKTKELSVEKTIVQNEETEVTPVLEDLEYEELVELAKSKKIPGNPKMMKKETLIKKLKECV